MMKTRVYVVCAALGFWFAACGGNGGGGVSVGTAVEAPSPGTDSTTVSTVSNVYIRLAPKALTESAAPAFAPMAIAAGYPVTSVALVHMGIKKIKVRYADDCERGREHEVEREQPYTLSLTDGVIIPEPAPVPVSRGSLLCRLKLDWSGGSWDEEDPQDPPSLYIEGWLNDGRFFQLATSRVREFEIKPRAGIPVTSDVVALSLSFPYRNWLQHLDPTDLESSPDGLVRINDDDNDEFLDGVELGLEKSGRVEKEEECDVEDHTVPVTNGTNICKTQKKEKDHENDATQD